mmetsp:Transcript_18841/g.47992  ORF Transcript_18841/g.47992 Transcript_18841/m.47992 type:complete len:217 (-) Transcript_18841:3179-3829(-)
MRRAHWTATSVGTERSDPPWSSAATKWCTTSAGGTLGCTSFSKLSKSRTEYNSGSTAPIKDLASLRWLCASNCSHSTQRPVRNSSRGTCLTSTASISCHGAVTAPAPAVCVSPPQHRQMSFPIRAQNLAKVRGKISACMGLSAVGGARLASKAAKATISSPAEARVGASAERNRARNCSKMSICTWEIAMLSARLSTACKCSRCSSTVSNSYGSPS